MKHCNDIRMLLPLLDSDELTTVEKQYIDDHLVICNRCREELAAIRTLHADLQRATLFEPSEAMLADLRRGLRHRLRQESRQQSWRERLASLLFGDRWPLWQLSLTVATVLIGIVIGRYLLSPPLRMDQADMLSYLTAGKPVAIESGSVAPSLANVQMIRIDPVTKQVEIHFSTVNDVQLRGRANDPPIRQALLYALREEDRLNVRLKAVKAIGEIYTPSEQMLPDDELIQALLYVLEHDANAGVRLKAAQALKQIPLNSLIKSTLIRVLLHDESAAVRIQAIETLSRGRLSEDELGVFHAVAAADTNSSIRFQARRFLSSRLENVTTSPD